MTEEKYLYKIIVSPFTKREADEIRNYLYAFCKEKTVDIEAI